MGNKTVKPYNSCSSDQLFDNIVKLSRVSSADTNVKKKRGYDTRRNEIISDIKQNLKDGANIYFYGNSFNNNGIYNCFQYAYVLNQHEIVELMIPYLYKDCPPYYSNGFLPFLTHAYAYRGKGYFYKSNYKYHNIGPQCQYSVSSNIYKKYLKIASDAEKKDLKDYKNKSGKYSLQNQKRFRNIGKYYSELCYDDNININQYLNSGKFIPPEFRM